MSTQKYHKAHTSCWRSLIISDLFMEKLEVKIIVTVSIACKPRKNSWSMEMLIIQFVIKSVEESIDNIHFLYMRLHQYRTKPRNIHTKRDWGRYVDDVIAVVTKGEDKPNHARITWIRAKRQIIVYYSYIDAQFTRKEGGTIKLIVFGKQSHIDQYLNFTSYHPIQYNIGVVRSFLNRCEKITTEKEDRTTEVDYLKKALHVYGYLPWTFKQVTLNQQRKKTMKGKRSEKQYNRQMVLPPPPSN